MIKLGNLKIKNRIFLAPMHQVNDIAFRLLCKKAGAGLTYTGLLNPQTHEKLYFNDKPVLQLACNSSKGIKELIKKYDKKISMYDFNLGCPSPHAKSSKMGYFMTSNFEAIEDILKTIRKNTKKPLTLKIRKMPEEQTNKIIKLAEKYCNALGIHPRTQPQGYSGIPDLEFAKKIKKQTKLPIIYSGNINNKEQAEKMLKEFDFIMIGRASIGNPNIFSELTNKHQKITFYDWLKLAKKIQKKNLYFNQIKFQAINFTRDFPGSAKIRNLLSTTKTEKEILEILKNSN
ncbi:MAG: tRNA-dihydrouridine synthase family protein [archaeon]|nr:tRNA-dihydrouridine synthase family protein [archaeon]